MYQLKIKTNKKKPLKKHEIVDNYKYMTYLNRVHTNIL